jgi:hypothetical protein
MASGYEIISNSGCNILTTANCYVLSALYKCTSTFKIVRTKIQYYLDMLLDFKEWL